MTDVLNAIDAQSSPGYMEFCTSSYGTVLVTVPFQKPSFSEASQAITALGVPLSGVAANAGTVAIARVKDGSGNVVISGLTVGTSGTDIVLNATAISASQDLSLFSMTLTHG
ncbi:MAG: hypothetical protein P4L68_10790 [Methylovirgula sp.]|nr:hypothetical protein [Methylovirgula sp.]